jgi:hypothetical protein
MMEDNEENVSLVNATGILGMDNIGIGLSTISPYQEAKQAMVWIYVNSIMKYVNEKNEKGTISLYAYSVSVPFDQRAGFSELIRLLFDLRVTWRGFVVGNNVGARFIQADSVREWQVSEGLQADGILGHKSVAAATGIPSAYTSEHLMGNVFDRNVATLSATREVRINFGHFIRQACLNLYASDDASIIGKLYDMRFKMGGMGSESIGSVTSLDDIECITEAGKLAGAAYFDLRDDFSGSFLHVISQDEYLARTAAFKAIIENIDYNGKISIH